MNEAQYFQQFSGEVDRSRFYVWYRAVAKNFELRSYDEYGVVHWVNGEPYSYHEITDNFGRYKTAAEAWRHLPE